MTDSRWAALARDWDLKVGWGFNRPRMLAEFAAEVERQVLERVAADMKRTASHKVPMKAQEAPDAGT